MILSSKRAFRRIEFAHMDKEMYSRSMPDGSVSPDLPKVSRAEVEEVNAAGAWEKKWREEEALGPVDPAQRETEKHARDLGYHPSMFSSDESLSQPTETRKFHEGGQMPNIFANLGPITDPELQSYVDLINDIAQTHHVNEITLQALQEKIFDRVRATNNNPVVRNEGQRIFGAVTDAIAKVPSRRESFDHAQVKDRAYRTEKVKEFFDAADALPKEGWQQAFNPFTIGAYYQELIRAMQTEITALSKLANPTQAQIDTLRELREDIDTFQTEEAVRAFTHDLNQVIYRPNIKLENILDFIDQSKSSEGDYALRSPGVRQMMDIYEECLRESMVENHGFLVPEEVQGYTENVNEGNKIVTRVRDSKTQLKAMARFRAMAQAGLIYNRDDSSGNPILMTFTDDEIRRIFFIARGGMVLDLRILSIAAESKLPRGSSRWNSLFLQDALQGYSVYRHLIGKFSIGEESMMPLLFEDKFSSQLVNFIRPSEIAKVYREWEHNPDKILDALDEAFPINRTNPYRMGDLFTYQSWRYDAKDISIITGYMNRGIDRHMQAVHGQNIPTAEQFRDFLIYPPKEIEEEHDPQEKTRLQIQLWAQKHSGAPGFDEYKAWADKYEKWTGTSMRFEKMRMKLVDLKPLNKGGKEQQADLTRKREKARKLLASHSNDHNYELPKSLKDAKDTMDAFEDVTKQGGLMDVMVRLQPHRMFRIMNERERDAIIATLPANQRSKEAVERALMHLSFAEADIKQRREQLIANTDFDNLDVVAHTQYQPANAQEWQGAVNFANAFRNYYNSNKGQFHDELIYYREYRHGFALWVDAPLDEFNYSSGGDTVIGRRARDNKLVGKAAAAELKLIGNLKKIQTPDQIQPFLDEIFHEIEQHDPERARMIVEERLKMYLKFFAAGSLDNIPGVGFLNQSLGKDSVARLMYGRGAPSWKAEQVYSVIKKNKDLKQIRPQKFNEIKKDVAAGWLSVGSDLGSSLSEVAILAFMLYMISHLNDKS